MRDLEQYGQQWIKNIEIVKAESREAELEHIRFRDADDSTKGGALLGFSGLMLAADLVFLSAGEGSYLSSRTPFAHLGFAALFLLCIGSLFATWTVLVRTKAHSKPHSSVLAYFGALRLLHKRRRFFLDVAGWLTILGTVMLFSAVTLAVVIR